MYGFLHITAGTLDGIVAVTCSEVSYFRDDNIYKYTLYVAQHLIVYIQLLAIHRFLHSQPTDVCGRCTIYNSEAYPMYVSLVMSDESARVSIRFRVSVLGCVCCVLRVCCV